MRIGHYGLIFGCGLLWLTYYTGGVNIWAIISVTCFTIRVLLELIPNEEHDETTE